MTTHDATTPDRAVSGLVVGRRVAGALAAAVVAVAVPVAAPVSAGAQQQECMAPSDTVIHPRPWAQQRLAPERAWVLSRGASVTVAVVGTGVSAAAPALAGAVAPGVDVSPADDAFDAPYEPAGGRADSDCSGHGTFAAALIAAREQRDVGFAGVAPGAAIVPVRVTVDPQDTEPAALAAGVRAAVDSGARIVAVTLSTAVDTPAMRDAVTVAQQRDVLVVASAAAPRSSDGPAVAYPAALPGVLAVAAIARDGASEARALGAAPLLAAPGEELVAVAPAGAGHTTASAAEMSVAFVAGAAALVRDRHPGLTAAEVARRLTDTADHPPGPLPHPAIGHGVVDPTAAVAAALPADGARVAADDAPPLTLPAAPVVDRRPARIAVLTAAAVLAAGVLAALVGVVARHGRRRRWRAGPTPF